MPIRAVFVFKNGMAMVVDDNGQQMPRYQGLWSEMREAIERDKPEGASIFLDCEWHDWRAELCGRRSSSSGS